MKTHIHGRVKTLMGIEPPAFREKHLRVPPNQSTTYKVNVQRTFTRNQLHSTLPVRNVLH